MQKAIRYIGSKEKLLPFLSEVIFSNYQNISILDGFTGTTVVSKYIQQHTNFNLFLSDISDYSEILSSRLYLAECTENVFSYLDNILLFMQSQDIENINGIFFNEFSINGIPQTFSESRRFFTHDVGIKIDYIRNYIFNLFENKSINYYEKNLLLMVLLAFADKNANTTSVYGAYLKDVNRNTIQLNKDLKDLLLTEFISKPKSPIMYSKGDILTTLNKIPHLDVIYLDPPYNTRKYESNYHILNYICNDKFSIQDIKNNSKTGLPQQSVSNSFGSKQGTQIIFKEMILHSLNKCNHLFISYSTDGEFSMEQMQQFCSEQQLILDIYTKDYKKYTSNSVKNKDLKEIIYRIKHDKK